MQTRKTLFKFSGELDMEADQTFQVSWNERDGQTRYRRSTDSNPNCSRSEWNHFLRQPEFLLPKQDLFWMIKAVCEVISSQPQPQETTTIISTFGEWPLSHYEYFYDSSFMKRISGRWRIVWHWSIYGRDIQRKQANLTTHLFNRYEGGKNAVALSMILLKKPNQTARVLSFSTPFGCF